MSAKVVAGESALQMRGGLRQPRRRQCPPQFLARLHLSWSSFTVSARSGVNICSLFSCDTSTRFSNLGALHTFLTPGFWRISFIASSPRSSISNDTRRKWSWSNTWHTSAPTEVSTKGLCMPLSRGLEFHEPSLLCRFFGSTGREDQHKRGDEGGHKQ